MNRGIRSTIHRLGGEAKILTRSVESTDAFNNPNSEWTDSGETVECVRTYPNRNTEVNNRGGTRNRDHPVFLFERSEAPPDDSRLVYDGITYELQSPTIYDTHVAIFGEIVSE